MFNLILHCVALRKYNYTTILHLKSVLGIGAIFVIR